MGSGGQGHCGKGREGHGGRAGGRGRGAGSLDDAGTVRCIQRSSGRLPTRTLPDATNPPSLPSSPPSAATICYNCSWFTLICPRVLASGRAERKEGGKGGRKEGRGREEERKEERKEGGRGGKKEGHGFVSLCFNSTCWVRFAFS